MMERLTERIISYSDIIEIKKVGNKRCKAICDEVDCKVCPVNDAFKKLAEYEDLEEQGLLLRLPCKVGDSIYRCGDPIKKVYEWDIEHIEIFYDEIVFIDDSDNSFTVGDIGKTVFLTREEAERKLQELENPKEICGATGLECIHCNAGACDNRRVSK